jgi:hypothetical protein
MPENFERPKAPEKAEKKSIRRSNPLTFRDYLHEREKNLARDIKRNVDTIRQKFGVRVQFVEYGEEKQPDGTVKMPTFEYRWEMTEYLVKEMQKLPKKIWDKFKLERILITGGIGKDHWGNEYAGWMADDGTMKLGFGYPLYHELFHRIDHLLRQDSFTNDDVAVFFMEREGNTQNERYRELKDHTDRAKARDAKWREICKIDGIDALRWSNEEFNEDRANTSARLFDDAPDNFADWPSSDEHPARAAQIKKELYDWSEGLLDEQYWSDLRAGKVDEKYWEVRLKNKK